MANDTHGADHAVETLAEHGAEHAGPAFPPFDTSTFASQLFWLAIAFVLLYLFLSRLIQPKLGGVIEQRKGKIASDLDEAARMKAEADEALVEADKQLATARAEARLNAEKPGLRSTLKSQKQAQPKLLSLMQSFLRLKSGSTT